MEVVKIIFLIAIAMALSITITTKIAISGPKEEEEEKPPFSQVGTTVSTPSIQKGQEHDDHDNMSVLLPSKRVSRFLAKKDEKKPRAGDHCHKNKKKCKAGGANLTCCHNKCMDLLYDNHNCGACKRKCKYTQACCKGKCVDLAFEKGHCGQCDIRCKHEQYCIYGMCDYA
ncbi:Stigma-specific protein [Parasponia andersonii]|uniref:Stigma-specific protein n=1 Tax=Parasponia andersonii TaxID=3476 RepID=A0A2P5CNW6_PARAD|nr:Stigma-specific protein [Parasponia andersonii]